MSSTTTTTINPLLLLSSNSSSSSPASSSCKFFIISRRFRIATVMILIVLNTIFLLRKHSDITRSTTREEQLSSEPSSPFQENLIRLMGVNNNDSSSYPLELLSAGQQQQQREKSSKMGGRYNWRTIHHHHHDDYCHPITNITKIVNNSYHNDIIDFKGCPTFYPLSEFIKIQNEIPQISREQWKIRSEFSKIKKKIKKLKQQKSSSVRPAPSRTKTRTTRRRRRHITRAICHFRAVEDYWYEMPHAMQQLYACFSFWMSHVDAYNNNNTTHDYPIVDVGGEEEKDKVNVIRDVHDDDEILLKLILIWDTKRKPIDWRRDEIMDLHFVHGMLEIFRTVFHVEIFDSTDHMQVEYYPNYDYYQQNSNNNNNSDTNIKKSHKKEEDTITDIYVDIQFSVLIQLGQEAGYRMQNSHHAEILRTMTANYYPHIFNASTSVSVSASATAITTPEANDDSSDTVVAVASNKTMATSVVTAGCPHHYSVDKDDDDDDLNHHPVIGILNRAPGLLMGLRTIDNVNLLQKRLQDEFSSSSSSSSMMAGERRRRRRTATIRPIQYFENTTVWEQLAWFHNVDIVISPHGAQLTGLPFIPKCGGLLEYFPRNYYLPYYFGSLASVSGLHYIHMYLGQNVTEEWYMGAKNSDEWQIEARTNTSLCVPIPETLEAVQILIDNWHSCCSKQT